MKNQTVLHIGTGGTIDSSWDAAQDTARPNRQTFIPEYLQKACRAIDVESNTLFLKDSREITLKDQDLITDVVTESNHKRIMLTSGTYLMADIARVLAAHPTEKSLATIDKRIILTGALVPLNT